MTAAVPWSARVAAAAVDYTGDRLEVRRVAARAMGALSFEFARPRVVAGVI